MFSAKRHNKIRQNARIPGLRALFLFAALASGCSDPAQQTTQAASGPVTLTIGLPVQTGEDPLHGATQAARLISREGLTLPNRDGRVQPRLAESWVESADGLEWRFRLRPNAFFHDGTPVDAQAVKTSLERSLMSSDIEQYPGLTDIVAIDAPAKYELVIRLKNRSTFLLDDLGVPILKILPGSRPIAAGPYQTVTSSSNELVMQSFSKYYKGPPQINRIVWKAYPTVRTAWAAMMRGEIDFLYEVPRDAVEFIEPETSVQVFPFLRNYEHAVVFNSKRPPLDTPMVRRALNYAVNRDALVEHALRGRGRATSGPAWPLHWAYDVTVPGFAYDPGRSAALLDAARLPLDPKTGGSGDRAPSRLDFTCLIPDSFTLWERMALIVQKDLAKIGVDMRIESMPFPEFNKRIAARDFDAVMLEFIVGNSPSRPYGFWHSQSKQNVWGFQDPRVDQSLDGIRRASTETLYKEAFRDFQLHTLEDPPAIFLALSETVRAVNKRFHVMAPPNSDILPTIADWKPNMELERSN
jgi:peptide/nickel transport system substrate-binding protein